MTIIKKPNSFRELGNVDVSTIANLATPLSESFWSLEDSRKENDFSVFHHTQHIIFRFISGNRDHQAYYSNPIWNIWESTLLPIIRSAVEPYNFQKPTYPKVMLARLKAGNSIDMHIDGRGSNLHTHKIHIPIQTNPQSIFLIGDDSKHLKKGVAYEVNNVVPHGAINNGNTDRIHLIFEVFDQAVQKNKFDDFSFL